MARRQTDHAIKAGADDLELKETRFTWFTVLAPSIGSSFSSGLLVTVLPLFLISRGVSLGPIAAIYGLMAIGSMLVSTRSGRSAHRLARPLPLLTIMTVQAAAFPAYLLVDSPAKLIIVGSVGTLAGAMSGPVLNYLITEAMDAQSRATGYARQGLAVSISYGTALAVASFLLSIGFHAVFLAGVVVSGSSLVLATVFLIRRRNIDLKKERLEAATRDLYRSVVRLSTAIKSAGESPLQYRSPSRTNMNLMSTHMFFFSLGLSAYPVVFPLFLLSKGVELHWIGSAVAGSWFLYAGAQPLGARIWSRWKNEEAIVRGSLMMAAVLNAAIAVVPLAWVIVSWMLLGIIDGIGRPVTNQWLVNSVSPQDRGAAFGKTFGALALSRAIGPLSLIMVVAWKGFPWAFVVASCLVILSLVPLNFVQKLEGEQTHMQPAGKAV